MEHQNWISYLKEEAWAHVDFSAPFAQRRKTGLGLLIGFSIMGGVVAALGSDRAALIWSIGAVIGVGVMLPVIGRTIYCALMGLAGLIAFSLNVILLGLFFYLVITPGALIARLLSKDFLNTRTPAQSMWHKHNPPPSRRQYHHLS